MSLTGRMVLSGRSVLTGRALSSSCSSVWTVRSLSLFKPTLTGRFFSLSRGRVDEPRLLPLLSLRARVYGKAHSPFWSRSFLCPWRRVLARTVGPRRSPSSTTTEDVPAVRTLRTWLKRREARTRSGRAVVDAHKGKSRLSFFFFLLLGFMCK